MSITNETVWVNKPLKGRAPKLVFTSYLAAPDGMRHAVEPLINQILGYALQGATSDNPPTTITQWVNYLSEGEKAGHFQKPSSTHGFKLTFADFDKTAFSTAFETQFIALQEPTAQDFRTRQAWKEGVKKVAQHVAEICSEQELTSACPNPPVSPRTGEIEAIALNIFKDALSTQKSSQN